MGTERELENSIVQIYPDTAQKGCAIIKPAYEVRHRKDDQSLLAKMKQSAQVLKSKKRE